MASEVILRLCTDGVPSLSLHVQYGGVMEIIVRLMYPTFFSLRVGCCRCVDKAEPGNPRPPHEVDAGVRRLRECEQQYAHTRKLNALKTWNDERRIVEVAVGISNWLGMVSPILVNHARRRCSTSR